MMKIASTDEEVMYDQPHITIAYDKHKKVMITDWKGVLTLEQIKDGGLKMIDIFQKTQGDKVLNSNLNLKGGWPTGVEWAAKVWAPAILEAGVKYFAWIQSPDNYAGGSSAKRMKGKIASEEKDEIFVKFYDVESGWEWLLKQD